MSSSIILFCINSLRYIFSFCFKYFFTSKKKFFFSFSVERYVLMSSTNFCNTVSADLMHSFCITYFQLFSITGIEPLFILSKTLWINWTNKNPFKFLFLKIFGFIFFMTLFLNNLACSRNSFLNLSSGKCCKFCKSDSSSTGRTITNKSFSLK